MQDIHSIGGGRFFAAAGGGGDRRLRPHHHHHHHHHHQNQQQALKCPRCDSLNTKFCYYNNYNLSQPRHFCKNCRRYWTKGGVLRNVPVGGGCRKTKRSKPKASSAAASATEPTPPTAAAAAASQDRKSNSHSHSSSESSSLTATNTNAATEAVSAPSTSSGSNLLSINNNNNNHNNQESKFFVAQSTGSNPSFEPAAAMIEQGGSDCGIFSEIGSFTSLITSSSTGGGAMAPFEFNSISDISISAPFRLNHQHQNQDQSQSQSQSWHQQQNQKVMSLAPEQELKMQEITAVGLLDQTASQADLSVLQDRSNGGGFGSLGDWQSCGDQGLFDLPNTVDQAYWSQSQWTDQDHPSLYLP